MLRTERAPSKEINESDRPDIRIWIAEDDEELREVLGESLAHGTRDVRLFENGQAVLEAALHSTFDILISDLMMPGADGIQVLHEVKRLHPESVVILMTGYASLDSAIRAIRGGAYDYIQKPFKLGELQVVIDNACEKVSLMRENRCLLQKVKEAREEMSQLREIWGGQLADLLGHWRERPCEEADAEMELILRQINPVSPDADVYQKVFQVKALDGLERLIHFRKEGFLSEEEFLSLKRCFFQNLDKRK